jgi:hypothetical protein
MKHVVIAALLLLPVAAFAQTLPPPTRAELQVMQNEMVTNLQAKLALQAQVIDLEAQVAELKKAAIPAPGAPSPAKKD